MGEAEIALEPDSLAHIIDTGEKGSYKDEDIYTNLFFGLLQTCGEEVMNALLDKVAEQDIRFESSVDISFDKEVDRRRPDAILESAESVLMVEVKTGSELAQNQLSDQIQDLEENFHVPNKHHIAITGDYSVPEKASRLQSRNHFEWISWYQIDRGLKQLVDDPGHNLQTRRVLQLIRNTLAVKGYNTYDVMEPDKLNRVSELSRERKDIVDQFESLSSSVVQLINDKLDYNIGNSNITYWGPADFPSEQSYSERVGVLVFAFRYNSFIYKSQSSKPRKVRPFKFLKLNENQGSVSSGISLRLNRKEDERREYKSWRKIDDNIDDVFSYATDKDLDLVLSKDHRISGLLTETNESENSRLYYPSNSINQNISNTDSEDWRSITSGAKTLDIRTTFPASSMGTDFDQTVYSHISELIDFCKKYDL